MKEKKFYVYLIKENGVVKYVGKTGYVAQRFSNHRTMRGTKYSAIPLEVDLNTIEIEAIEEFENKVDALKREDELMLKYDTINNGWNIERSGLIRVGNSKEYGRIKAKEWRDKNPEKSREYARKYYREHQEECQQRNRIYQQTHKEELKEHRKVKRKITNNI